MFSHGKLAVASLLWPLLAGGALAADEPSTARQQELVHLVRQDCGSCHGMTLQGGLGPALLPANLAGKADESLFAAIYWGRPGTPMPPWRGVISEADTRWIVTRLRTGFPNEQGR